jgi:hypothetical protein
VVRKSKLVCNVNVEYGNLKSENSQDFVQKPPGNCTFMNSASVLKICKHIGNEHLRIGFVELKGF